VPGQRVTLFFALAKSGNISAAVLAYDYLTEQANSD
jgi:hypothetical protein